MNIPEFISKWRQVKLTERSASHQHFLDLCEVFDHPKPALDDPIGERFTFEKGASKHGGGKGWADVWKRKFFSWEYKGKHKDLDAAYDQLLKYREALENTPLLVVCDMDRFVIHTNFTSTVSKVFEISLEDLDTPRNIEVLRSVFYDPDKLKPNATSQAITQEVAERLATIAQSLRDRGIEALDVARFLDRIVFCLFAEDVGLLPRGLFSRIIEKARDPEHFKKLVSQLFTAMNNGGDFGLETIRHFNGNLFTDSPVLDLTPIEIQRIKEAARLDWSAVDPSIFGTLFQRGLDPAKRSQLGAQYTSREDIETLIEPVVLQPLRDEWLQLQRKVEELLSAEETAPLRGMTRGMIRDRRAAMGAVRRFHERLSSVSVLDPACGSGNFLYVTLQKLKDLEKEVLIYAGEKQFPALLPQVGPWQFYGIEINPYAFELAQTTLWIGYLQWIQANGFGVPVEPILRAIDNFSNADALLDLSDHEHPTEMTWPRAEFIVGNPPFLGSKRLRLELGDEYVDRLFKVFKARVRAEADLVIYFFEKARQQIQDGNCRRAGLLATQGIRGGANREVLKRIKETGDIFFAESDRNWILEGAAVHVSMVGFDNGQQDQKVLDGKLVEFINSNLTANVDITQSRALSSNVEIAFMGDTKGGAFDIDENLALEMLAIPNPHRRLNSDVITPWVNGIDITQRPRNKFVIDFGLKASLAEVSLYEAPFRYLEENVLVAREKSRTTIQSWWLHERPRVEMRAALKGLSRFICTPRVSKYRLFQWLTAPTLADSATIVFAREDDYFFGVLHSRIHEVWSLAQGTQVRERESGFRYTPTTCFETFAFPEPTEAQVTEIASAAGALHNLRTQWLNPQEWVLERAVEFPGSIQGPWSKYVADPNEQGNGIVQYPKLFPRDERAELMLSTRTLTQLYNERPTWLSLAHNKLDSAVFSAYGWNPAMTDDEILAALLELNEARSETVS